MSAALLITNPVPACYAMTATRDILEMQSNFHGSAFDLLPQLTCGSLPSRIQADTWLLLSELMHVWFGLAVQVSASRLRKAAGYVMT